MDQLPKGLRRLGQIVLGLVAWRLVVGWIKKHFDFPMPAFAAHLIDNPIRRLVQPPMETARRHGLAPGMDVLEVGPGLGTYTVAAAKVVGPEGQITAIDIQQEMIDNVNRLAAQEGVTNIEARLADVHDLPFEGDRFDAAILMGVLGEIPNPAGAIASIARTLKPGGTIAFTEFVVDPDYTTKSTLARWAAEAGLRPVAHRRAWLGYTAIYCRPADLAAETA